MMSRNELNPREALDALRKLLADPDDTEQAFRVVRSLDGGSLSWIQRRMEREPEGRVILRERPSLLAALSDRDALARLPEGSLGRAYLAFCEREGIAPGGLVGASEAARKDPIEDDLRFVADRMRDSHDLWHLVTGYRTDLAGELCVLAFTSAQTYGPGVTLLVAAGYLRSYHVWGGVGANGRRLTREAFARGLRAGWLPGVPWERWLARPIDDVRIELGLTSLPVYRPFYSADLKAESEPQHAAA